MANNTEKSRLSDFSDYPQKSNLPPKHVKIHKDRRMFKSYCSRLKSYALYSKMKYGETS